MQKVRTKMGTKNATKMLLWIDKKMQVRTKSPVS